MATTSVMAEDTVTMTSVMAKEQVLVQNSVSDTAILSQVFKTNQLDNVQVMELSNKEMQDTQGAVAPLVYYAAVYGPTVAAIAYRWGTGPGPQILYHRAVDIFQN